VFRALASICQPGFSPSQNAFATHRANTSRSIIILQSVEMFPRISLCFFECFFCFTFGEKALSFKPKSFGVQRVALFGNLAILCEIIVVPQMFIDGFRRYRDMK
jgi:hypothetical protein